LTTENRAAFARRLGVERSTVTRWAETGQIVSDDGRSVDVEASIQRLHDTGGARPDVAARHADTRAARKAEKSGNDGQPAPQANASDSIGNSYQAARAVKEKYNALQAKLEYERQAGNLIPREDVDFALNAIGAAVRARLEVMADQIGPILAPINDLDEVHAVLSEHLRGVLASIADDLHHQESSIGRNQA